MEKLSRSSALFGVGREIETYDWWWGIQHCPQRMTQAPSLLKKRVGGYLEFGGKRCCPRYLRTSRLMFLHTYVLSVSVLDLPPNNIKRQYRHVPCIANDSTGGV
jgi:hypothetical protein